MNTSQAPTDLLNDIDPAENITRSRHECLRGRVKRDDLNERVDGAGRHRFVVRSRVEVVSLAALILPCSLPVPNRGFSAITSSDDQPLIGIAEPECF